jgi:hypothetical protein
MKSRPVCVIMILLVVAAWGASRAGDDGKNGPKVEEFEDDKGPELEKARQLIVNATPDKLQELIAGADDELAIRAAWESVRRQLARDIATAAHKNTEWTSFKSTDRFVGFVEGRLRVPAPQWWVSELSLARAQELERPRFFWDREVGAQIGPRGISSAFGVVPTIQRSKNDEVNIAWSNRKLQLSSKQIPNDPILEHLTGLVYRGRCIVVRYDRESFPLLSLEIYCVDPRSSNIVWSTKRSFDARLQSAAMGHSGASIHEVALVGRDDVVFVFGMELSMIYIEALRLSDGHPLMRFNSTY